MGSVRRPATQSCFLAGQTRALSVYALRDRGPVSLLYTKKLEKLENQTFTDEQPPTQTDL